MFDIAYLTEASVLVAEKMKEDAWNEFKDIPVSDRREFFVKGLWFNRMYMAYLYWSIMFGTHGV